MVESIKEVSVVVSDQIPTTTVRILLNHFKWDKERLMERLYSDDQEAMFKEAQVGREALGLIFTDPSGDLALQEEPCVRQEEDLQADGRAGV
jgi:hypothetical protein